MKISPTTTNKVKTVLDKLPYIQLAIIFGSISKGREVKDSDLDIAVAGEDPLRFEQKISLIEYLSSYLNSPIDLIDLTTASGLILQQALSKGKCILNKNKLLYAQLIKKMLFNQADMMPYHDMILRKRREKFIYG